MYRNDV